MNFRTITIIMFLVIFNTLVPKAFAQAESSALDIFEAVNENKAMINGYIWKALSSIQKKIYLQGYSDALKTVQLYNIPEGKNVTGDLQEETKLFSDISLDELILKIEEFYINQDNLPIPISYALLVARNQLKGYSEDAIEEYAIYLRRIFSENENMTIDTD